MRVLVLLKIDKPYNVSALIIYYKIGGIFNVKTKVYLSIKT